MRVMLLKQARHLGGGQNTDRDVQRVAAGYDQERMCLVATAINQQDGIFTPVTATNTQCAHIGKEEDQDQESDRTHVPCLDASAASPAQMSFHVTVALTLVTRNLRAPFVVTASSAPTTL